MTLTHEILPTTETLRRNIAGFKAVIERQDEREVIVKIWDDFKSCWTEPQRVKVEEVKEL